RLTFNRVISSPIEDIFDINFGVEAELNLELELSLADVRGLPKLAADLVGSWSWDFDHGASEPQFGLENLRIEIGSFITDLLKPITDKISDILSPFEPVVDVLLTPISGLDVFVDPPNLLGLINLIARMMGYSELPEEFFYAVKNMIDIAQQVDSMIGMNGEILLGDIIGLGTNNVSAIQAEYSLPSELQSFLDRITSDSTGGASPTTGIKSGGSATERSGFKILDYILDIGNWMKLITGGDATLFTYELPYLEYELTFRQGIATITAGPAVINIYAIGGFSIGADLGFGYDTFGIKKAIKTGNWWDAFDGFYIADWGITTGKEKDELTFGVEIGLEATLWLLLIEAGLGGKVGFEVGLDLQDINDDGKIRISELVTMWNYTGNDAPGGLLNIINLDSRAYFQAYVFVDVGISIPVVGKIMKRVVDWTIFDITLAEWEYNAPKVQPVLAHAEGDTLYIHSGKRAKDREYLDAEDGGEHFTITGTASSITVKYDEWEWTYTGSFSKVVADGGKGKDILDASGLSGVAVEFDGGEGDDRLMAGSGASAKLIGGEGNDTLNASQATGAIYIDGGKGDDRITGGSAASATNTLIGGEGDDRITAGDGDDQIDGGPGVDSINGMGGVDTYIFATGFGQDRFSDNNGSTIIDLSAVSDDITLNISKNGISLNTINEELRLGRSQVTKIILGTGNDKIFISDPPERTIEIEDTGGANTYTFTLGRNTSNKADGIISIIDHDTEFDEVILNNLIGMEINPSLPDILIINDHEIRNGREVIRFTDDVEQFTLIVQESKIESDSTTTFYPRDLTITSTNPSGANMGLSSIYVSAQNLIIKPQTDGGYMYFAADNIIIEVVEDVVLDTSVHALGDFDIKADSIGAQYGSAHPLILGMADPVGTIEHEIDAHDMDWLIRVSSLEVNVQLNAINNGKLNIYTANAPAQAYISLHEDITSGSGDNRDNLGGGTMRLVAEGVINLYDHMKFLGAGSHLILAGDNIYNHYYPTSNKIETTVGGLTVLTRDEGVVDGSEIVVEETDSLVIYGLTDLPGAPNSNPVGISSAHGIIDIKLKGKVATITSEIARLTLDSGSIITRDPGKDITLTADDFEFIPKAAGRDADPDRPVGGIIGTGKLTILTSHAENFLIGTAAEHPGGNGWTYIRENWPAFNNYPDHVGGNFAGEEGKEKYANDDTLFINTVHFSTQDLSAIQDGFSLITFGSGYKIKRMIFGDAMNATIVKMTGEPRVRDSSFRDNVIFNAERIYIEGEVQAHDFPLVTLEMNTERLHVKSKNINNPLGGTDSGITGDYLNLIGVKQRIINDGWIITNYGDIIVDIQGNGESYVSPMMSDVTNDSKRLNNYIQGVAGILKTNKPGGLISITTKNSVVLEGRTYVNGEGARITINAGTFFELVQIAGAMYAPGENSVIEITAPNAVYINGEILAGVEWRGGVKVPVSQGADVIIHTPHELRIFGAISTTDIMELKGQVDWDYNERDPVSASIHLTGQLSSYADNSLLRLEGPQDVIIEGSIFVRGQNSGLLIDSGQRVKFATSFVEVEDDINIFGRGHTEDLKLLDQKGNPLKSSVLVDATAVITSFQSGSNINIWGAHDIDIFGSIVAGGSIGPTGVTWSGRDSQATIVAGEQVYLDSGVLASDSVTIIGGAAGEDDVSLNPDEEVRVSVIINTAGGITSAGRTSDGSRGLVYIFGESGVEMMGHIYSGANKYLLWDASGNLIKETIDWDTSVGGDVIIESPGQVFIGGWTENMDSEVVLSSDVELHFEDEHGNPLGTVTIEASSTSGNKRLSDLITDIQNALDSIFSGTINVKAKDNRVIFYSNNPFRIASESINVKLLGLPGGDFSASEIVPDAEYVAPDPPETIATSEEVTLIVNKGNGNHWGTITFTIEPGLTLQELVDLLNDELDDSILNDFRVISEGGRLVFTNPYDFEIDDSSQNVDVLGMTDVAIGTVASTRKASTYEARAIHSLFGEVLVTGGYIASKNEIYLRNVDTPEHPYTGPDIGVRIQGSSEITTHEDYSLIRIDSKYDAEIEGHLIAGGEVENIRDAETGAFIGSVYNDFGTDASHTEIIINAEHQVRIGTIIKAGGLIRLTGGNDPFEGDPNDVFNFTGASILIYGSAQVETWGENSQIILDGPNKIMVLTPTHFQEIEPDRWVKGEIARIVAEGQFMTQGWLPVDVVLHMWKRDDLGEHEEYITIPSMGWGSDAGLLAYIQLIFRGSKHFSDLDDHFTVSQEGRYLVFTGIGYDFAILAEGSENIDLLGLAPVISSTIYYPDAELIADEALPGTGQLIADVRLDIHMTDPLDVTTTGSVLISASSTSDNTTLSDLIADINTALDGSPFSPINAEISDGKLRFTSLGYEFEILETSKYINLLGFRGEWETTEYRELSELTASGAVPTTGQLVRDVILVIRIEEADLDDVLLGAVTISSESTSTNTGISDLINDINAALASTVIPRYSSLDFGDYIRAEERDGSLVLVGKKPFKIKTASRNETLLGMNATEDLISSPVFFNAYIHGEADVPSAILSGNVTLDIEINRVGEITSSSVTIPIDATNSNIDDLVEDINAALVLSGFGDIVVKTEGNRLTFESLYDFVIKGTSINTGLLGLTTVAAGTDVSSSRQPAQYEVRGINPIPTTGVLAEDVTLKIITKDSDDNTTTTILTIKRSDTLNNLTVDDLAVDINNVIHASGLDITVSNDSGTLIFASETLDIEITKDSINADLLGLLNVAAGSSELSSRDPSLFELIGSDDLVTVGILPDNIALNVVMSIIDPNADPTNPDYLLDEPDPITHERNEVIEGTVIIYRDNTLDNTNLGDLIEDINDALSRSGFRGITAELDASNRIILSSPYAFEVDIEHAVYTAEAEIPDAVLTNPVTLKISIEKPTGTITKSLVIPVDASNTVIDDLYRDVAQELADEFPGDLYVRMKGDYLEFYSRYDFTIKGTSTHADLLGLSKVATGSDVRGLRQELLSNAYVIGYTSIMDNAQIAVRSPWLYRVKPVDSMVNGRLSDDLTLRLSMDGGTYTGQVTIHASATNGDDPGTTANASLADLITDINKALKNTEVPGHPGLYFGDLITAQDERGVIVFTSNHTFTIDSHTGDNLDQLGFKVGALNSKLSTPDYEIEGDDSLVASGVLTSNVSLEIAIDDGAGGIWTATVEIPQSETVTNTGVEDLLIDIENAFINAQVLDEGIPTGSYASQFIQVSSRSGKLVLKGSREFTIDGDTSINPGQIGLTSVGPGSDATAVQPPPVQELYPYDEVTNERISLPASRGLSGDVRLDLRIFDVAYPESISEYTVIIPGASTADNTSIDDLVDDINSVLPTGIWAKEEDGFIVFESQNKFHIEYKSENENLLGLTVMPHEDDIKANRSSNDGVLPDDVTFVLWVNLGDQKIVGEVTIPRAETLDNADEGMMMDLMLDLQTALNNATYVNLDGEPYGDGLLRGEAHEENFADDPVTVGGVADPIVRIKLKNGKILFASQYYFKILPSFPNPNGGSDFESEHAEILGLDTVADGKEVESSRPFNIIAKAAGSEVIFGSVENPVEELYIAGSVLSDHQITMVEGPETDLDLDWSSLLQTIDGPILLNLGKNGFLKGDLIAGGVEGDVILSADNTLTLNGHILANRNVLIDSGFGAGSPGPDSVTIAPTSWIRTNPLSASEGRVEINGRNNVIVNGPIGSLQTDEPRMGGDVLVTSQNGNIVITEESGWIETGGRIVLTAKDIDILGVVKNVGATAPEPVGDPTPDNYEVVIDASGTVTLTGDIDALGSILITTPNDITIAGSIEGGGVETFEFITEERGFIDGGDERIRIVAPNIDVNGGNGIEGADGSSEDLYPELSQGQTYPRGVQIVASGLIQLVTPGSIDIRRASELIVRHDHSLIYLEADYVDILGSLYAGANPNRVLLGESPGISWAGEDGGVRILASEMVTLGGDVLATDLDVIRGDASSQGETITRGGSIQATGPVEITVSGGSNPFFFLNSESFIKTDAQAVDSPTPGSSSKVEITTEDGILVGGVIQALDPDSDVTLVSGEGLLEIEGFVEAGDQLSLTGASASSSSDISVFITKLLYETKTVTALTTEDEERSFTIDMNGDLIDDYGFLLDRDGMGRVIVDVNGAPQRKIGANGYPELGKGTVYITYDETGNPVLVDKEGYSLTEYEVSPGRFKYFHVDKDGQFLDDEGFVINVNGIRLDSNGNLINKYGYLIDEYGNFIDENGDPINAYGFRVDQYGNLIDINGDLISADGYLINEEGLLINGDGDPLNGVGAIRKTIDIGGTLYLTDQYGNLVSSQNELIREISGSYYLINERDELVDAKGIPITPLENPVLAKGTPVIVTDPSTIEDPIPGAERLKGGSIQPGAAPMATTGPILVNLPVRKSGGTLNTTGPTGTITITGDRDIEIHGMVGLVYLNDSNC
ncbi:MAG: calcium-binding protein, partial [Candidatus Methanomethylicaceae archaeon]